MAPGGDLKIFLTYYLGLAIGGIGVVWGLGMFLFIDRLRIVGLIIAIVAFFIGKYFVFKSRKRGARGLL